MRRPGGKGLTLVELIVAIAIMGLIAGAAAALLSTCLQAHAVGVAKSNLYHEGLLAMQRMTSGARKTNFLLIPNSHKRTRDILAFSDTTNDDNDFFFDDPLFPRIDEDTSDKMIFGGKPGIAGIDDDGDGAVDEGAAIDDDEDGFTNEDPLDGLDNDADGNIDEDPPRDMNNDNMSGIKFIDDDGNGAVDEKDAKDNDEDGINGEDLLTALIYSFDSGTNTLRESSTATEESAVLSTRVTAFSTTYEAPTATNNPRILITLTLTDDDGASIVFSEYVYPRNIVQNSGKRVR